MRAKVPKTLMPILHWRKRIVHCHVIMLMIRSINTVSADEEMTNVFGEADLLIWNKVDFSPIWDLRYVYNILLSPVPIWNYRQKVNLSLVPIWNWDPNKYIILIKDPCFSHLKLRCTMNDHLTRSKTRSQCGGRLICLLQSQCPKKIWRGSCSSSGIDHSLFLLLSF